MCVVSITPVFLLMVQTLLYSTAPLCMYGVYEYIALATSVHFRLLKHCTWLANVLTLGRLRFAGQNRGVNAPGHHGIPGLSCNYGHCLITEQS